MVRASAYARLDFVTCARTRSPGTAPATNTTYPSRRATPLPPWASASTVSSTSAPRDGRVLAGRLVTGSRVSAPRPRPAVAAYASRRSIGPSTDLRFALRRSYSRTLRRSALVMPSSRQTTSAAVRSS